LPDFTVIIPNYNHARFLQQRIDSVLNQTFDNFEVIIIDDCSTDNSREIIEEYRSNPKVSSIIFNRVNSKSPFKLWEKGLQLAKAELIWVAESDDFCENNFLEAAHSSFKQFSSIGLFYSDGLIYDEDNKANYKTFSEIKNHLYKTDKWSLSHFEKGETELNNYLKFDCTINNVSGMVFKKKIAESFCSKGSEFRYFGDWFYYINISFQADLYYCNQPLNIYRKHKTSHLNSSNEIITQRKEYFEILAELVKNKKTTDKGKLLTHFAFFYLHPGLFKHGVISSSKMLLSYFRIDWKLACKITPRLILVKIFRSFYKKTIKQIEYEE